MNRRNLLGCAIEASLLAGEEILNIYRSQELDLVVKDDKSPLTAADLAAHKAIVTHLGASELPMMSEEQENASFKVREAWTKYWLIDPLDGTKEFINRNGEFTVNIALIECSLPTLGVVYAPALGELFYADLEIGSFRVNDCSISSANRSVQNIFEKAHKLSPQPESKDRCRVIGSRSHSSKEFQEYVEQLKIQYLSTEIFSAGSSLKFCRLAEGSADVYPRLGRTMEWDTAAGHIVAKAAGRKVLDFHAKTELRYNKEDLANPWFVVS